MNRYIEHIINDLVRDTRINYERERIYFPFHPSPFTLSKILVKLHPCFNPPSLNFHHIFSTPFSKYCKDTYGLTEEEIDYVWNQYKSTIKDKIDNK